MIFLFEGNYDKSRTIASNPNRIHGPVREMPYESVYGGDLDLTFRVGQDMFERKYFELWMDNIVDHANNNISYYDDYTRDIYLAQLGPDDSIVYKVVYRECYPKTINDLNKHSFISFGRGAPSPVYDPDWALKLGMKDNKKRKPIMKVNSVYGLLLAVQSGVGLAAIPDYLTVKQPNIVKVLPSVEGPITEAHFVYPQSMKNVARVQAFRNFLYSKISEWEF